MEITNLQIKGNRCFIRVGKYYCNFVLDNGNLTIDMLIEQLKHIKKDILCQR